MQQWLPSYCVASFCPCDLLSLCSIDPNYSFTSTVLHFGCYIAGIDRYCMINCFYTNIGMYCDKLVNLLSMVMPLKKLADNFNPSSGRPSKPFSLFSCPHQGSFLWLKFLQDPSLIARPYFYGKKKYRIDFGTNKPCRCIRNFFLRFFFSKKKITIGQHFVVLINIWKVWRFENKFKDT